MSKKRIILPPKTEPVKNNPAATQKTTPEETQPVPSKETKMPIITELVTLMAAGQGKLIISDDRNEVDLVRSKSWAIRCRDKSDRLAYLVFSDETINQKIGHLPDGHYNAKTLSQVLS